MKISQFAFFSLSISINYFKNKKHIIDLTLNIIVIALLKSIFLILEIREEKIKARDGCAEKRLKKNNKLENIKADY
jgi:hypothetical protein